MQNENDPNRRWIVIAVVFVAVLLITGLVVLIRQGPWQPPTTSGPSLTASPPSATSAGPPTPGPAPSQIPALETRTEWQLFARSQNRLFRFDVRSGQVVSTPMPKLTEQASFLAREHDVLVKPWWTPGGFRVRDGSQAEPLTGSLQAAAIIVPGPDGDLWAETPEAQAGYHDIRRIGPDGQVRTGESIRVPEQWGILIPDDREGWLHTSVGGLYEVGPTGTDRVDRGELIAVGPNHYLIYDCDDRGRCSVFRIDRRTRARTMLQSDVLDHNTGRAGIEGRISPDGRSAALIMLTESVRKVWVVDLGRGASLSVPGEMSDTNANTESKLAWSPDSRWLAAVTTGQIQLYDSVRGEFREIAVPGKEILQIAVRAG